MPIGIPVHVTNRGNDRRRLFFQPADYEAVLRIMSKALDAVAVDLDGYNVMPNHLHLVVRQRKHGVVSAYLHRVLGGIARHHRRKTGTIGAGHVFQSRFWSQPLADDRDFLIALRYVEDNAHRAGLVPRAEDWRWGSLWERETGSRGLLSRPFADLPPGWVDLVNEGQAGDVLERFRKSNGRRRQPRASGAGAAVPGTCPRPLAVPGTA